MTAKHLIPRKIFYHHWLCSIPEVFFYSTDRMTNRGTWTTGDKAYDTELMKAGRRVYITIPQMCDYFDQGAPITMINPQDTVELYQLITEHVENWKWVMATQMNFTAPPIEDFERLEALAIAYAVSVDIMTQGKPPISEALQSIRAWTNRAFSDGGAPVISSVLPVPNPKTVASLAWRRRSR